MARFLRFRNLRLLQVAALAAYCVFYWTCFWAVIGLVLGFLVAGLVLVPTLIWPMAFQPLMPEFVTTFPLWIVGGSFAAGGVLGFIQNVRVVLGEVRRTLFFAEVKDLADHIVAYAGYTSIAAQSDTVPNNPNANVEINSAGAAGNDTIAAATTNINTLTQNSATASIIDTSPGTLQVGVVGGVFITPSGASLTIGTAANSGTLTAGGTTATPRRSNVARFSRTDGCSHISVCMAGHKRTGARVARRVAVSRSSARPAA